MRPASQSQAPPSVRERLLAAAEQLFYADGIASTGVDAVVGRAGVATGSLYKNFGGKDGLVEAYLAAREQRWRLLWEEAIAEQHDPVERVLALFTVTEVWAGSATIDHGCALLAAVVQLPASHPAVAVARDYKQHVAGRLGELCRAVEIEDPVELCHDLLLLFEGMNSSLALGGHDPISRARRMARLRLGCGP